MKRLLFSILIIAFIIAKMFTVKASADLNEGLIAYYPFNGNASDESGNGSDGKVFGATLTEDRFGNPNNAYHFDGVDDYIDTNSTIGDNATALSVILWAYIETVDGWFTGIITRDREYVNNDDVWSILLIKDQFRYEISETNGREYIITQSATTGWHNLGLVYDGSEKRLKTYLDGELIVIKDTETGVLRGNTELKLVIGAYSGKSLPFSGRIDDIRIYNRVLSENEIQQLYNGPITITIPEDATEGDGVLEDQGIISVFSAPETDLVINLSSNDTSMVTIPETITIYADQNTSAFDITIMDNCIEDVSQTVTLTASSSCYIPGSDTIQIADNDISIEMKLPSGWSMISLPVIPCSTSISSLFPEAKTVYTYKKDSGYVHMSASEDMEVGKGYWMLLDQNQNLTFTGRPIQSYNKTLYEYGWEMIGGCTYSAKASVDGCNIGVIYDYVQGAGYQRVPGSEDLKPGKGYWMLFRDFTCPTDLNLDGLSMNADFLNLLCDLDYPIVVSKLEPNLEEPIIFIKKGHDKYERISEDQIPLKTFNDMDTKEREAYNNFANKSKIEIAKARHIDRNDNELLFPEEYRDKYNSPDLYLSGGITAENFLQFCEDCPFVYTEQRTKSGIITSSSMKLKSNEEFTLSEGLYFFVQLTLEKGSVLKTDGDVQIYVKKLELEEDARLIGGPSSNPDEAKPNDLVILAQRWEGAYYDPEDGVKLRPKAKIFGHIFAPDLKVRLSRGSGGKETRVHGSILTSQLVTYIEPGKQASYGPIQIIYEEYLGNLKCTFELNISN